MLRGHSASDETSVLSTSFSAFFWRRLVRFRWILGLGALPSVVALLASLQGPEDSVRGSGDSLIEGFRQALSCRQLQRRLIGTAGSWFLFDVAAYGGLSTKDTKGSSCHETGPSWTPKKKGPVASPENGRDNGHALCMLRFSRMTLAHHVVAAAVLPRYCCLYASHSQRLWQGAVTTSTDPAFNPLAS